MKQTRPNRKMPCKRATIMARGHHPQVTKRQLAKQHTTALVARGKSLPCYMPCSAKSHRGIPFRLTVVTVSHSNTPTEPGMKLVTQPTNRRTHASSTAI